MPTTLKGYTGPNLSIAELAFLKYVDYAYVTNVDGRGFTEYASNNIIFGTDEIKGIYLKPGHHYLKVKYADKHVRSSTYQVLEYDFEAGKTYYLDAYANYSINKTTWNMAQTPLIKSLGLRAQMEQNAVMLIGGGAWGASISDTRK